MSQILHETPSSRFQTILNDALEEYRKRTKNDLIVHPLVARLQLCSSPSAILNILRDQLDQPRSSDESSMTWLDPTVNILYALSATLGEGVGLVRSKNVILRCVLG
jgi:hypothetical protein